MGDVSELIVWIELMDLLFKGEECGLIRIKSG